MRFTVKVEWQQEDGTVTTAELGRIDSDALHSAADLGLKLSSIEVFEPMLTAEEAAAQLRMHTKTLQRYAREGRVPCIRQGKYWRFRLSSLDLWVKSYENQASQPSRVE